MWYFTHLPGSSRAWIFNKRDVNDHLRDLINCDSSFQSVEWFWFCGVKIYHFQPTVLMLTQHSLLWQLWQMLWAKWPAMWSWSLCSTPNLPFQVRWNQNFKMRSERCKCCTLAVVRRSQKLSPNRRPLPGGTRLPKLISCRRSLPLPTKSNLVRIDARKFELSW